MLEVDLLDLVLGELRSDIPLGRRVDTRAKEGAQRKRGTASRASRSTRTTSEFYCLAMCLDGAESLSS